MLMMDAFPRYKAAMVWPPAMMSKHVMHNIYWDPCCTFLGTVQPTLKIQTKTSAATHYKYGAQKTKGQT